ncbi:MAG: hypothetical protein GY953_37590 [bacterium]|nr:hypothetical protein [bacterium]
MLSGLRYRVERADSGGAWSTVAASSSFGLEDALRLRVEADVSGYLTVTDSADPSGAPVFSGSVTADGAYTIPSAGSLPAPTQPGPRTLRLVLQGARTGVEEITLRYEDR